MAKDDYFVIAYKILAYLYRSLKEGTDTDPAMLECGSPLLRINRKYWLYIVTNMQEQGFITGILFKKAWEGIIGWELDQCQITPKGIEYLCENSTIKKAYRFLKDAREIVPFDLI